MRDASFQCAANAQAFFLLSCLYDITYIYNQALLYRLYALQAV
jgi:hypothetical protein